LPEAFDGLEGLLEADLKAVVSMLATRANERLLLTRREQDQLIADLWNGLTEALSEQLKPFSVACR
jgi:hypothetical protein